MIFSVKLLSFFGVKNLVGGNIVTKLLMSVKVFLVFFRILLD